LPPRLTNDTAEFSFRQLAIARMKFGNDFAEFREESKLKA